MHPASALLPRQSDGIELPYNSGLELIERLGLEAMLSIKKSLGGSRVIPKWAEQRLAHRLESAQEGFKSYGEVQQWLETTLGVEAEYHTVYQMTRYRLKAKLKVPRPQNSKQDPVELDTFKKTLQMTLSC